MTTTHTDNHQPRFQFTPEGDGRVICTTCQIVVSEAKVGSLPTGFPGTVREWLSEDFTYHLEGIYG